MKKVVITALFGVNNSINDLPKVNEKIPGWDYILFTNCKCLNTLNTGWEIKIVELLYDHPIYSARYYKWLGHKYLNDYDIMLWIDSYLSPNVNFNWNSVLSEYENNEFKGLFFKKHIKRKCIYQECRACVSAKKASNEMMSRTIKFLNKEKMPYNYGLYETGIYVRYLKNNELNLLLENLFSKLLKYSYRDQTILTYILWKNNYKAVKSLNNIGNEMVNKSGTKGEHIYFK